MSPRIVKVAPLALVSAVTLMVTLSVAAQPDPLDAIRPAVSARYPRVSWTTAAELSRWMEGGRSLTILDTRPTAEYRVAHLRGARQVEPDESNIEGLHLEAEADIIVYCSVGWRSGAFADRLLSAGYGHVWNLEGGLFRWANEGREMFDAEGRRAMRAHPYDEIWGRLLHPSRRAPLR